MKAAEIPGLQELWAETLGDPCICIAVLDGPVDRSHPSLAATQLTQLENMVPDISGLGPASQHGTHIASVIFGQHEGLIQGIAPHCRGLIVPVFKDGAGGSIEPCSQLDLARAITYAAQEGAHIINISGGELSSSGTAHPLLADAVQDCANRNILIVAAAGNDGCECIHVPGALPSVLAVGAMDAQGLPLDISNWGEPYRFQGVLAPGEKILGASPGGGVIAQSGTSYATPIVSGIAALLLSLQRKSGREPSPQEVRAAILESADRCEPQTSEDCRPFIAGSLNVCGALTLVMKEKKPDLDGIAMDSRKGEQGKMEDSTSEARHDWAPEVMGKIQAVTPSQAQSTQERPALVYALGTLGYDFGTEARRESIAQHMGEGANLHDHRELLGYLEQYPSDAAAIGWILRLDATPIYAIQPQGAFAQVAYDRLRQFLREQLEEGAERVSIPGVIIGRVGLMSGQVVPVIWPEPRCMYSWTTAALVNTLSSMSAEAEEQEGQALHAEAVTNFLERVYYELRNLGITPQERAINFSATNALNVANAYEAALREQMQLDTIEVERSPICRPDSDCWDVKLTFFNPSKLFEQARRIYRFTVDVSDVCPVMVGKVRSWYAR